MLLVDFPIEDVEQPKDKITIDIQVESLAYGKALLAVEPPASGDSPQEIDEPIEVILDTWLTYTYGSHNKSRSGLGFHLISPEGTKIEKVVQLEINASNNEA